MNEARLAATMAAKVTPHANLAQVFLLAESKPEQRAFCDWRERLGDNQIDRSRPVPKDKR